MFQVESMVLLNEKLNKDSYRMVIDSAEIASEAKPGQFLMVRITEINDPLFRRPFSIFRRTVTKFDSLGVEIVYKIVGRATRLMSKLRPGDKLDIIGPLGHGFELRKDRKTHILIGGGTGVATLFMLGEEISKENNFDLFILIGAKNKDSVIVEKDFRSLNAHVMVSTDDGTYGYHGLVTEMFLDLLENKSISTDCTVYASGPESMLKRLVLICKKFNLDGQIAMERHMMCGFGACLSCVCKIDPNHISNKRDLNSSYIQIIPGSKFGYALTCKEGPVFDMEEVIFDE